MNINHRAEAEKHLSQGSFVSSPEKPHPIDPVATDYHLRMAQVHATLAADQTTSADASAYRAALIAWRHVVSHAVAWNIAFSETDEQHEQWVELAEQLSKTGLDIRADVDRITPDFGRDPAGVWKPPTVQREEHLRRCAEMPTPWSDKTDTPQ